jgi:NADPH:quinone reductase-like Zn-dependent oxidoreductase
MKNTAAMPFPSTHLLESIAHLLAGGKVATMVQRTFALPETPQAHELSQTGHGRGRIVLHIAD